MKVKAKQFFFPKTELKKKKKKKTKLTNTPDHGGETLIC